MTRRNSFRQDILDLLAEHAGVLNGLSGDHLAAAKQLEKEGKIEHYGHSHGRALYRLVTKRRYPIKSIDINLDRSSSEESRDEDTALVHEIASKFPDEIRLVRVHDENGVFLYYGDAREED